MQREYDVFLMGTAGDSLWRDPVEDALVAEGITPFNPVVEVWDEAADREEKFQFQHCSVLAMYITGETTGLGSLAESGWAAFMSFLRGAPFVLRVDPHTDRDVNRARKLLLSRADGLRDVTIPGTIVIVDNDEDFVREIIKAVRSCKARQEA